MATEIKQNLRYVVDWASRPIVTVSMPTANAIQATLIIFNFEQLIRDTSHTSLVADALSKIGDFTKVYMSETQAAIGRQQFSERSEACMNKV
jgi:hypothetical protein